MRKTQNELKIKSKQQVCQSYNNNSNCSEKIEEAKKKEEFFYFLKPTEFIQNKEKTLKEYIIKKNDSMIKKNNINENDIIASFQVIPNIVIFTSYTPFQKYEKTVSLKNTDTNTKSFTFGLKEHGAFKISYVSDAKKRVAPGMLFTFKVEFYPKSCDNYEYDLEIYTENKLVRLPIRCINEDISLDIEDEIIISDSPIYMKNEKTITIKNTGKYENKFQVILKPPFYINSTIYMLKPNEIAEIKVVFFPIEQKTYEDYLIINYQNGLNTYTKIQGKGIVADVVVENEKVIMDDIYINEQKEISVFINNKSFFPLTYNIIKYDVYEYKYDDPTLDITDVIFEESDKIIERKYITDKDLTNESIIENVLYNNEEDAIRCEDSYSSERSDSSDKSGDSSDRSGNSSDRSGNSSDKSDSRSDRSGNSSDKSDSRSDKSGNRSDNINSDDNSLASANANSNGKPSYKDVKNKSDNIQQVVKTEKYSEYSNNSLFTSDDYVHKKKKALKKLLHIYPRYKKLYNDTNTPVNITICPSFASFYKIVLYLFIKGYKKKEKIELYLKSKAHEIIIANDVYKIDNILINTFENISFDLINCSKYDVPIKIEKVNDIYNEMQLKNCKFVIPKNANYMFKILYMPKKDGLNKKEFIIYQKYTNVKKRFFIVSNCVMPNIEFDLSEIRFDNVSHSFDYKRVVNVTNKSNLVIHYFFNIPNELKNEIKIVNDRNVLEQHKSQEIVIHFCPKKIKTYVSSIDFFLNEIPIYKKSFAFYAICSKPNIEIEPVFLKIEPMIIDKNYNEQFRISNKSEDTDVKYEIFWDDKINNLCDLEIDETKGIIKRESFKNVQIDIKSKIIGYLLIVIKIKIYGCEDISFVNIKAQCTCPTIKIIPNIIDFEKCSCLTSKEKIIEIKNESPINTFIHLSNQLPIFSYLENHLYIEPYQSAFVHMTARCLETTLYSDTLRVIVHRKEEIQVPIKAQGIGSPIFINEECIDFEIIHTNKKHAHELVVFNKGFHERSIYFSFESDKKKKKKVNESSSKIFSITPEKLTIKEESEAVCILSGFNSKEEKSEDFLYIYEDANNLKKTFSTFKKIQIIASFVHPEVEIGHIEKFVYNFFEYNNRKPEQSDFLIQQNEEPQSQALPSVPVSTYITPNMTKNKLLYIKELNKLMQEIEIFNLQNSHIKFVLTTKAPFSVDSDVIELRGKEKNKVRIFFDVDFMNNKINATYEEILVVNFFENNRRQKFDLIGETIYPNIKLSKTLIDFQYILKNLFTQETIEIENVCNFKVFFKWYFDEKNRMYKNVSAGIDNVFNINPSKGYLLPLEKKNIIVTFASTSSENYYNINMICQVKNGAMYNLKLLAGHSDIVYSINKTELNYDIHYKSIGEDIITIHNTGKIQLFIEIIYTIKLPSLLYTNINNFFIEAQTSKDIIFYFLPAIPLVLTEFILIKICNFEEIKIKLNAKASYSLLYLYVDDDNKSYKDVVGITTTKREIGAEGGKKGGGKDDEKGGGKDDEKGGGKDDEKGGGK
ncbi:conserved protein, unknown function, partial [Hepatocystis sp. ex Piliocolobus tephrosceles]